jgi:Protein of unknown function (DUF3365)
MQSMRAVRSARVLFGLYTLFALPAYGGEPDVAWDERSRALADQLLSELKAELGQAMQQGGPIAAVAVCKARAPQIAARLSASSGADVSRTAIRLRNPANAPDDLERAVMQAFEAELSGAVPAAAPPEAMFEFRSARGTERRYLRAIVMQPVCLACHGATLTPDLATVIAREYPQDAATGFETGQLRGAVIVRWPATRQ